MTIDEAIEMLVALKARYGGAIEVFYDCQHCGKATVPSTVATVAVRLK